MVFLDDLASGKLGLSVTLPAVFTLLKQGSEPSIARWFLSFPDLHLDMGPIACRCCAATSNDLRGGDSRGRPIASGRRSTSWSAASATAAPRSTCPIEWCTAPAARGYGAVESTADPVERGCPTVVVVTEGAPENRWLGRGRAVWPWLLDETGIAWTVATITAVAVPRDEIDDEVAGVVRSGRRL